MPEKMKTIHELIELEEFELCLGEVSVGRVFCGAGEDPGAGEAVLVALRAWPSEIVQGHLARAAGPASSATWR